MLTVLAWLGLQVAQAAPTEWEAVPYWRPILNVRAVTVGGITTAQGIGGAEVGMLHRYRNKPHWLNRTRAAATGLYSFTASSLGADARLGTFWGPDGRRVRWQIGPDLWFNGYGTPTAFDYHLPWSPGVDLRNAVRVNLVQGLAALGEVTPGWAFVPARAVGGVGPFHELTLMGALAIETDPITFTVGYQRSWWAVGTVDGIVLSGRL